jgi:hypothetical protein
LFEGYGVLNETSRDAARAVIGGLAMEPSRPDVDAYMARLDMARDAFWTAHEKARHPT